MRVLYNDNPGSSEPTATWPVISQQYQSGVYKPQNIALSSGLVQGATEVWTNHFRNGAYLYALKVHAWNDGSSTIAYDGASAPFHVDYFPTTAWYDGTQQVTGQSSNLLKATLVPNVYTITYNLNAGTDTVTGAEGAPLHHKWSFATNGIPTSLVRTGYDFLGWTLPNGSRWNFDTDTVSETVTLTASWKCLHDFDNGCDTKCNNCGYTRTVTHKWANKCDTNCNVCGYVRSITHEWSNNCDGICNVCGFERQPAAHVYDHVVCDPDCNECGSTRKDPPHLDGNADGICDLCGKVLFIVSPADKFDLPELPLGEE
jgi:uncharacterized repeat protein (TIGR02543 family)